MRVPPQSDKDLLQLSVRPYLLRAWYDWCVDQQFTPYITVFVDQHCAVPMQFVQKNSITLNLAPHAVMQLLMHDQVSFKARFGGVPHDVLFPVGNVTAIYALENQVGMAFTYVAHTDPPTDPSAVLWPENGTDAAPDSSPKTPAKPLHKGHLTVVK